MMIMKKKTVNFLVIIGSGWNVSCLSEWFHYKRQRPPSYKCYEWMISCLNILQYFLKEISNKLIGERTKKMIASEGVFHVVVVAF